MCLTFLMQQVITHRWQGRCSNGIYLDNILPIYTAPCWTLIALPGLSQHRALTLLVTFGPSKKHLETASRRPLPLLVLQLIVSCRSKTQLLRSIMNHDIDQSVVSHSRLNLRFYQTTIDLIRHVYTHFAWSTNAISPHARTFLQA